MGSIELLDENGGLLLCRINNAIHPDKCEYLKCQADELHDKTKGHIEQGKIQKTAASNLFVKELYDKEEKEIVAIGEKERFTQVHGAKPLTFNT